MPFYFNASDGTESSYIFLNNESTIDEAKTAVPITTPVRIQTNDSLSTTGNNGTTRPLRGATTRGATTNGPIANRTTQRYLVRSTTDHMILGEFFPGDFYPLELLQTNSYGLHSLDDRLDRINIKCLMPLSPLNASESQWYILDKGWLYGLSLIHI